TPCIHHHIPCRIKKQFLVLTIHTIVCKHRKYGTSNGRAGSDTMKAINIIGAFTVLACNLVVSFSHTLGLFRAGGFSGGLEIIATVGVETVFIMGALNIVVARLRGVSPGVPAILGGLLGVALVSWSNVSAGWEYGITGILLG